MSKKTKAAELDIKHNQLYEFGCDVDSRTILLFDEEDGEVDANMSYTFNCNMTILENISNDPIYIRLSSSGGSCYEGFNIIDRILNSPCEIHIHASGRIMSMGLYILVAGDVRTAHFMTDFMHHEISDEVGDARLSHIEAYFINTKNYHKKMVNYLASRTKQPTMFWSKEGKMVDHYFDAQKALDYGIVDEVI
jgi:ATP-dependent Clp protease protease subunit